MMSNDISFTKDRLYGCWYCDLRGGEMAFSIEFDTYVHPVCLALARRDNPTDPEARIMVEELPIEVKDNE